MNRPTPPLQYIQYLKGLSNNNSVRIFKTYFRKFEAEFKKAFARESSTQGG
jgi:hypothetical protein